MRCRVIPLEQVELKETGEALCRRLSGRDMGRQNRVKVANASNGVQQLTASMERTVELLCE